MRTLLTIMFVALTVWSWPMAGSADGTSKQEMQSLDEQVQVIKSDVLRIASELGQLEEKLLYPSNTQVGVFVSLVDGEILRLDSVQIQIDGEFVAHHVYDFKELEALQKGGVQRIYHRESSDRRAPARGLGRREAKAAGTSPGNRAVSRSQGRRRRRLLGITLTDPGARRCRHRHRALVADARRTGEGSRMFAAAFCPPGRPRAREPRDLYFGESLYYANQGHYFEALERLDAETRPALRRSTSRSSTRCHHHIGRAEFSVGDFELYYRMHHRAGRAITARARGQRREAVRNEAAYRLARIHFQKGQLADASDGAERNPRRDSRSDSRRRRVPARERLRLDRPGAPTMRAPS